jgi:type II secretory pathway component PulK
MKIEPHEEKRQGQAMLLAVLTLGATMLGATTIAGLLMLYQIRQTTDFGHSAQAIFAADAGTEWALYSQIQQQTVDPPTNLSNGATALITCYDASGAEMPSCMATTSAYAKSTGSAGGTRRAFLATFQNATGTLP